MDHTGFLLPPGTQIASRYSIGKKLGQGGFGIAYKGSDTKSKRLVAIKELFVDGSSWSAKTVMPAPTISQNEYSHFKSRFKQEAETLGNLDHPAILKVLDYVEENDTAYIVME